MRFLICESVRAGRNRLEYLVRHRMAGWSYITEGWMRGHVSDRDGVLVKPVSEYDDLAGQHITDRIYVLPVGNNWPDLLRRATSRFRDSVTVEYIDVPGELTNIVTVSVGYAPRDPTARFLAEHPTTGDWLRVRPIDNPHMHPSTVLHEPSAQCFVPRRWMQNIVN